MSEMLGKMQKGEYALGTTPTHAQLAKDDYEHHFHPLAAGLATKAVRNIGDTMRKIWDKKETFERIERDIEKIFCHPVYSSWAGEYVIEWAKGKDAEGKPNSARIERGRSPSIVLETTLRTLEEADKMYQAGRFGVAELIAAGYGKDYTMQQAWEKISN